MNTKIQRIINTVAEMERFGKELSCSLRGGDVVFFQGQLGAGKTTLIRGILRGWNYSDFVKSPSYSLIELYPLTQWQVVHIDLYRLMVPQEIQNIGLCDYLESHSILLIEWPERAEEFLPKPTWRCQIEILDDKRRVNLVQVE